MKLSPYFQPTAGGDCVFNVEAVKIKFGFGAIHEVGAEACAFGMKRVAIFTDKNVAKLEPVSIATNSVKKAGLDVAVYKEVEVEPTDRSFKAGAEFAKEGKFDGYISVGGGSVMDTCKAANLYSTYPAEFTNYVNAPIGKAVPLPGPLKPHIACPTTFGTASECTGIAIFDFLEMKAKTGAGGVNKKDARKVLADHVTEMMKVTGIPNGLKGVGYSEDDLENLTEGVIPQRRLIDNAPMPITRQQLRDLYERALTYW